MNITVTTQPPFGAVTLASVWEHLRVDVDGSPLESPLDDTYRRNILTATREFEKSTRTSVVEQSVRISVGTVPSCGIRLQPPVQSITSVKYRDSANALQAVDAADYYLTDDFPPHLMFVTGWSAPTLYARPDAIRVEYIAGYAADGSPPELESDYQANIPSGIKDAVLLRVEQLQANTSPQDDERLARAIECIERGYRVYLSQT